MDTLASMVNYAAKVGVFNQLGKNCNGLRASLYADDVVFFLNARETEFWGAMELLRLFGDATGLHANWSKSAAIPMGGTDDHAIANLVHDSGCPVAKFSITYLGMPLSDSRLWRVDQQPVIDKLAKRMGGWKARHIALSGRVELVRATLSAMVIFQLMVLDPLVWLLKKVNKLRRGFLWAQDEEATAGKCLVN